MVPISQTRVLLEEYQAIHGHLPDAVEKAGENESTEEEREKAKLSALRQELRESDQAALCLSGGGIRSATFCLGVLQGLARWGELDKFHYLSTVSGGGYIGSWLSRWIKEEGLQVVATKLGQPTAATWLDPEPQQIRHLRAYSSYLAPRRGLSKDSLTLTAIYLRNLFLNWLVLVPLIFAVGLLPRLLVLSVVTVKAETRRFFPLIVIGFLAATIAIAFVTRHLPPPDPTPGQSRSVGLWFTLPLIVSAIAFSLSWATQAGRDFGWEWWVWAALGAGGAVGVHVVGVILATVCPWLGGAVPTLKTLWLRNVLAVIASGAFGGIALLVGTWLFAQSLYDEPVLYSLFAVPYLLISYWVSTAIYVGLSSRWTSDDTREWWARAGAYALEIIGAWVLLGTLVLYGPEWFLYGGKEAAGALAALGGVSGLVAALVGFYGNSGTGEAKGQHPLFGLASYRVCFRYALRLSAYS